MLPNAAITSLFGFWEFVIIVLICEPGERVAIRFELFNDELEHCTMQLARIINSNATNLRDFPIGQWTLSNQSTSIVMAAFNAHGKH